MSQPVLFYGINTLYITLTSAYEINVCWSNKILTQLIKLSSLNKRNLFTGQKYAIFPSHSSDLILLLIEINYLFTLHNIGYEFICDYFQHEYSINCTQKHCEWNVALECILRRKKRKTNSNCIIIENISMKKDGPSFKKYFKDFAKRLLMQVWVLPPKLQSTGPQCPLF